MKSNESSDSERTSSGFSLFAARFRNSSRSSPASRATFPDQRNEVRAMHHADDAVIVEFDLLGTQRGPLLGIGDKP